MKRYIEDIRELIGETPLLKINAWELPTGVEIFAKLEYLNPGGSVKDRLGMTVIEEAERNGLLKPKGVIIEPTAGNTGIGLALAALKKGYQVICVVPQKFSAEKQSLMRALGAQVINTPTADGMEGAMDKADELARSIKNSYVANQFKTRFNPLAHYKTTAPELHWQLEGQIDFFLAGVGTGGTFSGVARYLKENIANIKTIAVEPQGSILGGGEPGSHLTEGIGVDFIPDTLDLKLIDEVYTISDQDAFFFTGELAKKEGLLVGSSSGSAFAAALKLARTLTTPARIAVIFPDRSDRYFSKDIYDLEFTDQGGI